MVLKGNQKEHQHLGPKEKYLKGNKQRSWFLSSQFGLTSHGLDWCLKFIFPFSSTSHAVKRNGPLDHVDKILAPTRRCEACRLFLKGLLWGLSHLVPSCPRLVERPRETAAIWGLPSNVAGGHKTSCISIKGFNKKRPILKPNPHKEARRAPPSQLASKRNPLKTTCLRQTQTPGISPQSHSAHFFFPRACFFFFLI